MSSQPVLGASQAVDTPYPDSPWVVLKFGGRSVSTAANWAIVAKLVDKTGTWLRFGEVHLGQGREKARQFLKDNPEVAEEIRQKILESKEAVIAVEGEGGGAAAAEE